PLGPVMLTDTAGIDDEGALGSLRIQKTRQILNKTDIAVLVTDCTQEESPFEAQLKSLFVEKKIPYITVRNKCDLLAGYENTECAADEIFVSAAQNININKLKELIAAAYRPEENAVRLVGDIIAHGDLVVLVIPIDESAPKGRLILPQQQAIRDILESGAFTVTTRETELTECLERLGRKPDLVITDSQAFGKVAAVTPKDIPLTSFSILMARYKGFLDTAVKGVIAIDRLNDGDTILISEGCTHHRQCGDIGTVKLPAWLRERTGKELIIETSSGTAFPDDLSKYSLIIHCGGCMLSPREMIYRMKCADDQGIPFTNYGTAIAFMKGILRRSLSVFPQLADTIST
ncbi:MAG: [FeFe] hydrogenase H-cluster maturation GTPase HydF, partial [Oscillospiraceae bacterium]|nr:[FeFe] hydrogenase H-cluster maturation GTPase HydF [Oscillospiraceae bacterium]